MRRLVLICNIASLLFTVLVIAGDGPATETTYIVLMVLLLLIPAFTLLALARPRTFRARAATILGLAGLCNLVLLAFVGWALVDQHPHPNEPGFLPYAALMILTPVLSAIALLRRRPVELPQG
jgi:peptidoglycan/LPS O-acetylase OafA/YrhL